MASAAIALIQNLGDFLKAEVPRLQQVLHDFPSPSEVLKYPSISIDQGAPKYEPMDPYVISKGDEIATGENAGKSPVVRVVGKYEYTLQLDIWAKSKPERREVYELIFQAFHKSIPGGISIQMTNYHNVWAHYDLVGYDFPTNEVESQKGEWRAKLSVLASCFAVAERNEFLIKEIENNLETPASIDSELISESPGDLTI